MAVVLTAQERHRLNEIGEDLQRTDPRLARSLAMPAGRRRRTPIAALVLLAVSVQTEIVGALARQPVVCALAWLGMAIATIVVLVSHEFRPRLPGRLD